jgi:hypothetical protein
MFLRRTRLSSNVGALGLVLLAVTTVASTGCSSSEGRSGGELKPGSGDGGSLGSGASGNGSGGVDLGSGGNGTGSGDGTGPDGQKFCQAAPYKFEPQTPTVYVLVDRSGSIFGLNQWGPLRDAVLPVIQELQADVRFGFGTYSGTQASCVGLEDMGSIGLNNYDAIAGYYGNLGQPVQQPQETPTAQAIDQTVELLGNDAGAAGPKAILLVTADDDNDFCDNPAVECGNDAVISAVQVAHDAGVKTFVFGLDNGGIDHPEWFDYWAQAGQGEQPNWADALNITQYNGKVYDACNSLTPWKTRWTALGRGGFNPIGLYSTAGGTAKAFLSADTTAVANEIRSKVQGLKNCIFDLSASNVEVKEGAEGTIYVNNEIIPDDQWKMNSPTVLELTGDACTNWLKPEVTDFFAGFACEALIIK